MKACDNSLDNEDFLIRYADIKLQIENFGYHIKTENNIGSFNEHYHKIVYLI